MNIYGFSQPKNGCIQAGAFLMTNTRELALIHGVPDSEIVVHFQSGSELGRSVLVGTKDEPLMGFDNVPVFGSPLMAVSFDVSENSFPDPEEPLEEKMSFLWTCVLTGLRRWVLLSENRVNSSLLPPRLYRQIGYGDLLEKYCKRYQKSDWSQLDLARELDIGLVASVGVEFIIRCHQSCQPADVLMLYELIFKSASLNLEQLLMPVHEAYR